jgi:hypothetical protein
MCRESSLLVFCSPRGLGLKFGNPEAGRHSADWNCSTAENASHGVAKCVPMARMRLSCHRRSRSPDSRIAVPPASTPRPAVDNIGRFAYTQSTIESLPVDWDNQSGPAVSQSMAQVLCPKQRFPSKASIRRRRGISPSEFEVSNFPRIFRSSSSCICDNMCAEGRRPNCPKTQSLGIRDLGEGLWRACVPTRRRCGELSKSYEIVERVSLSRTGVGAMTPSKGHFGQR